MAEPLPSNVHVSRHPCVRAKLSQLRSRSTSARDTQTLVHEIATLVGCEALGQALTTQSIGTDTSPLGYSYTTESIAPATLTLVPILRSGLSMLAAVQALLPEPAAVHHLGMYREKSTLQPVEYYNNLPYYRAGGAEEAEGDRPGGPPELAIVLDPVVATGQTLGAAIDTLRDWGVRRIVAIAVLASDAGLRRAAEVWPEGVEVWVGAVDERVDDNGMIVPGLGDIGDRLFMTLGK